MEKIIAPILIIVVLLGAWWFLAKPSGPARPLPPIATSTGTGATVATKVLAGDILEKADMAISSGQFRQALELLAGHEDSSEPRAAALLGYAYAGLGKYELAIKAFERACRDGQPDFIYALGHVNFLAGRYPAAISIFQALASKAPAGQLRNRSYLFLAKSAEMANDIATARDACLKLIAAEPKTEEAFVRLYKLLRLRDHPIDLAPLRARGDAIHGRSFSYQFALAQLLYDRGDWAGAMAAFRRCVELESRATPPYFYLYKLLRREKRLDEAVAEIERLYQGNASIPRIYFEAALDARRIDRLDLAFKFYRTAVLTDRSLLGEDDAGLLDAIKKHVKDKGSSEEKAWFKAFELFVNSEFRAAVAANRQLLPKIRDADLLADARLLANQADQAVAGEDAYSQYLAGQMAEQQARMAQLQASLNARQQSGQADSQIQALKRQALSNPNDAKLQYRTALELSRLGDREGAKDFLRQAMSSNPSVPEFFYSLSRLTLAEGDAYQAREHCQQALRLNPRSTQALSLMAEIEIAAGNTRQAIDHAQRALTVNPNNTDAHLLLARSLMQENRRDEAKTVINQGLEVARDPMTVAALQTMLTQADR